MARAKLDGEPQAAAMSLGDRETTNRLLILGLIRNGVSQKTIADALGFDESKMSRLFAKGVLRTVAGKTLN